MEPGNSRISLIMENFILKETHDSASPSLVSQTPSEMYSNRQLHTQNNPKYI